MIDHVYKSHHHLEILQQVFKMHNPDDNDDDDDDDNDNGHSNL